MLRLDNFNLQFLEEVSHKCQENRVQRARDVKKNEKAMSRARENKRQGMKRMSPCFFESAGGVPTHYGRSFLSALKGFDL